MVEGALRARNNTKKAKRKNKETTDLISQEMKIE